MAPDRPGGISLTGRHPLAVPPVGNTATTRAMPSAIGNEKQHDTFLFFFSVMRRAVK